MFEFTNVPDPDASPSEPPPFPIPIASIPADAALPTFAHDDPVVPPLATAASLYAAIESSSDCLFCVSYRPADTHFDSAGTLSKLTFLNPFVILLPVLVLLMTAITTVISSANTQMMYPFLIPPANGGSSGIESLHLLMASLILAIVSSSTPPLSIPLILLLTLLGLVFFPFSTPQFVSLDHSPSRTLLPTLPVIPLPFIKCFPFHAGHPLPRYVSPVLSSPPTNHSYRTCSSSRPSAPS